MTAPTSPGPDPITLLFRYAVEERARALFAPGGRVLELSGPVPNTGARFDGACSFPGALDGVDLDALGRALAATLGSGAPVLLCLPGRGGGDDPREARLRLGREFAWTRSAALGVLLPDPSRAEWARRHPQAFGLLAALERAVRGWPLVRWQGAYAIVEGHRR